METDRRIKCKAILALILIAGSAGLTQAGSWDDWWWYCAGDRQVRSYEARLRGKLGWRHMPDGTTYLYWEDSHGKQSTYISGHYGQWISDTLHYLAKRPSTGGATMILYHGKDPDGQYDGICLMRRKKR